MRNAFREIVEGWMTIDDFDDLTDRIERTAALCPLEIDEAATVEFMIECQIARGLQRGDFDDAGS